MGAPAISAASLRQSLASARPPLVIDVRKTPAFLDAGDLVRGALRRDPALAELALIVRGADTGRLDLAPQAAGLAAISLGLSLNFKNDHEMLERGMIMYDALCRWCKEGKTELHTWNPEAYK